MRRIVVLASLCASCGVLAGQTAQNAPAPADTGVTIRTGVNEVALDLVVRDKKGKVVKTLKPADVEIYEDGVRQELLSFRLVAGPGKVQAAAETAAPAKPRSLPLKQLNVVCIVFQNLDPNTKQWAVDAAREFLKGDLPLDSWVGVFNMSSRLSVLQPFTNDRKALAQAAKNAFTGTGMAFNEAASLISSANPLVATADQNALNVVGGELNASVIGDVTTETTPSAAAQRGDIASQRRQFGRIDAMRQTDQVVAMIQEFSRLPGRKTILLICPGLTMTQDPDRFQNVVRAANKASVTFYGVDARGLSANSSAMATNSALGHVSSLSQQQGSMGINTATPPGAPGPVQVTPTGSAGAEMAKMRQDDELHDAVRGSDPQAGLRALSEGTGGFMVANTNDLRKPFQRIVDDVDTHYEAVYRPTSDKLDGRLRKLEVKLAKADYSADSRAGYFAMPEIKGSPLKQFEMPGLVALSQQPQPHAFDFQAGAFQFRPQGDTSQFGFAFEVPVANLTTTPIPEVKKHRLHLSLLALVKDAHGNVIDKFSQDSPYEVPDDNLAAVQTSPVSYSHPLSLPPGRYSIETAVVDWEGRRTATSVIPIESPERKGLSLSSLMVVKQLEPVVGQGDPTDPFQFEGRRVVPEMSPSLPPTAQPFLYFVVYPDRVIADKPTVEIQVSLDGQVIAEQEADLKPPDATGAIPVVIGGAPAKPGTYEMKVTATQGNDSVEQTVKYSVSAQADAAQPGANP